MTNKAETLPARAKSILSERGYDKPCYPLDHLAETIEGTSRNLKWKVFIYKWSGLIVLALVPIISTTLSLWISDKAPNPVSSHSPITVLSYCLTFLTLLNSIFKPGERFKETCSMRIEVDSFGDDLLAEIEKMPKVEEASLLELAHNWRKNFVPYQKQLIRLFLPETAVQDPEKLLKT
jgi:hypothetical protein